MTPSQIASLVVALLLAGLGIAEKFAALFPPNVLPFITLAQGLIAAGTTRLVAPFLPGMLPPRFGKVLSQLTAPVLAMLGVLAASQAVPVHAQPWIAFSTALLGALATAILPHEGPAEWLPSGAAVTKAAAVLALILFSSAALAEEGYVFVGMGTSSGEVRHPLVDVDAGRVLQAVKLVEEPRPGARQVTTPLPVGTRVKVKRKIVKNAAPGALHAVWAEVQS